MTTEKFKWQTLTAKYAFPETWRSAWQVANSLIPFFLGWYLMYRSLEIGYWLALILAIPTAGFMVRLFIVFHDCCHGSFFKSVKANDRLGLVLGVLVLTPFYQWKHSHAIHHATRTASITGAYVALHDAVTTLMQKGLVKESPLRDSVATISVGIYQGTPVLDLDYPEDSDCDTDMNVVMLGSGHFVEVQGTAEGHPFSREEMDTLLGLAKHGIGQLTEMQRNALAK